MAYLLTNKLQLLLLTLLDSHFDLKLERVTQVMENITMGCQSGTVAGISYWDAEM